MNSALIVASLFFSYSISSFALCSEPPTPCEWYAVHHGYPTFVGTAVSEETVSDVLRLGEHVIPVTVQKVTFRVEESFEDTPDKIVDVYGSGTTNDLRFKVGIRYLVRLSRQRPKDTDGQMHTVVLQSVRPQKTSIFCAHFQHVLAVKSGDVCCLPVSEHKSEP